MTGRVTRKFRDVKDEEKDPSFPRQRADTAKDKHRTATSVLNSDGERQVSGDRPEKAEGKDVHT